ncbi:Uncharacterized protein APZ42_010094, partial [Daphnia magna]
SHFFNGFNHVNCRIHFSSFPMSWDLEKVPTFFHFSDLSHFLQRLQLSQLPNTFFITPDELRHGKIFNFSTKVTDLPFILSTDTSTS